jgi:Zn-dependent peptidase ImmA (M78 family)
MRNVNTLYQKKVDLLKDRVAGKITTKKFNTLMDKELIETHKSTGISKEMLVYRMLQMDPKSNHYTG